MEDFSFFLQPDKECFYDLRPGARYFYFGTPLDTINNCGLRGPVVPQESGNAVRIACLGDSSTFGMCVPEEATWVRQLEGLLRERRAGRRIETINAGVIGYTVLQGLRKYETKLQRYDPDIAILAFGAINEQMPSLGATDFKRAAAWDRDYRRHLGGIADKVWKLRTVQFVGQGLLEVRARERGKLLAKCAARQAEFEQGRPYQPRMSYDEFEQCLTRFVETLKDDGCLPILMNPHRRESTETRYPQVVRLSEIILQVADAENVPVFDCNHLFKENPNHESEYFADTHHPNAKGNQVIAEALAEFLEPHIEIQSH